MSHALWSDGFRAEERTARTARPVDGAWSLAIGLLGLGAMAAEVVLSVLVTAHELSDHGSWGWGLLAIGLGFSGPYAALLSWRSIESETLPPYRRVGRTAFMGLGVACIAVAWLLLLSTFGYHPPTRLVP